MDDEVTPEGMALVRQRAATGRRPNQRLVRLEDLTWEERQELAAHWEAALRSIADNTCCEGCQEAARVARAALSPREGEG